MYSLVLMAALTGGQQSPELFFHKGWHGCHGYAGCYGGCYGYGYGGWGGHGCHGCAGWGGGPSVAYGCWGWDYGCYGGCGGYGSMAYMPVPTPVYGPPMHGAPVGPDTTEPKKMKKKTITEEEQISTTDRARLVIELPPGAKLFVDDRPINNVSTRKRFHTPALQPGNTYYYEVRAEVMVDGERVQQTRRVVVRAGQVVRADFRSLGTVSTVKAKPRR